MKKYVLSIIFLLTSVVFLIAGISEIKKIRDVFLGFGVLTDYFTNLSSSITATQTTIPVASITDRSGLNALTFNSSTVGDAIYLAIEGGTSRSEVVRCTSLSGTTFGGCTRGLSFGFNSCSATTGSSTLSLAHNSGSRVVNSNVCQTYSELVAKDTAQTSRGLLTLQYGSLTLGDGAATTTNNTIIFDGNTDGVIRYNRSSNQLEGSNDGISFSQLLGSTSSIADAGYGLFRVAGTGATNTVFNIATGTPVNRNGGAGAGGLEFFNCRGTVPTCDVRIFTSNTSPLVLEFASSSGFSQGASVSVSSSYFIGTAQGPLGWTSSTFVIDADNQGSPATTSLVFHRGGAGDDNRRLRVEGVSGDWVLGYRNDQDLARFTSTTPAGTYGTSTLASNFVINGNIAFSTSTNVVTASSTFSNNLVVRGNIGLDNLLLPTNNNTSDLGALGLQAFRNIYASTSLTVGTGGASTTISSNGALLLTNNLGDIGAFGSASRNVYVSSSIFLGNGTTASTTLSSNGNILFSGSLLGTATSDIGSFSLPFRDFYVSSSLRLGNASGASSTYNANFLGFSGATTINTGGVLSLNTINNQNISIGAASTTPNTDNTRDLGSASLQFANIYARASSTIPRSFAAGQATQATDGVTTAATLTINHNLGIIPSWIRIFAIQRIYNPGGEGLACCSHTSSTNSLGVWVNGLGPTQSSSRDGNWTSTTYVQSTGASLVGGTGNVQSTTNTIAIRTPSGPNIRTFAQGSVANITSSTFAIIFNLLNYSDGVTSPILIQWEASQ